ADERFADFAARDRNRDALLAILDAAFAERTSAEWLEILAAGGVPAPAGHDRAAAPEDPQTQGRGARGGVGHPPPGPCPGAGGPSATRRRSRARRSAASTRSPCSPRSAATRTSRSTSSRRQASSASSDGAGPPRPGPPPQQR